MFRNLIYKLLYKLIHQLYTIFEFILYILNQISGKLISLHHMLSPVSTTTISLNRKHEEKVPLHLTVLLGDERPSYPDLTNIIIWCLMNRIVYLSFYDYKGILNKHQMELENELMEKLNSDHHHHVIWHNNSNVPHKNGYSSRKIHVKILPSANDGRNSIVNATKTLAKEKRNVTIKSVDALLHKDYEFPDPDLGLYFGKCLNFFNYPPWQLRLTEFLNIDTHHNMKYETFVNLLNCYGQCEQKLGK